MADPRSQNCSAIPASTDPAPGQAVVLYDGRCPFCRWSIRWLQRLDWLRRLHYQDCHQPERWPPTPQPLQLSRLLEEMHLVTPDRRRVYAGYQAFRWIAWRLPLTVLLAPLLYLPGMLRLGERLYRWVARNRYQLVPCRDGVCSVPRPETAPPTPLPAGQPLANNRGS